MIVQIPKLLNAAQLTHFRDRLATADWTDGRVSAGHQGAAVKRNRQLPEESSIARELGDIVVAALERNPTFISSVLPNRVYPPMFNRYDDGMAFGLHIDNAVRMLPRGGDKLRTDVSATLFLEDPANYDGGELQIEDSYGAHAIKLPAGDLVVYPAGSRHCVTPVTRGVRTACFFWAQSLVRDDAQRALLFDLDCAVQKLNQAQADAAARLQLTGCYHNLLRMWSQP